jgi:hypothetical protein
MTKHPLNMQSLALAAAALLALSAPAFAAPLNEADLQADRDAQHHVEQSVVQLDAHHWRNARGALESAETALLNRESLDLGVSLDASRPLPKTDFMTEIDAARTALTSHDPTRAREAAASVDQQIGAEIGAEQNATGPDGAV